MVSDALSVAILVVSSTASKDASADASGPALKAVFEQAGNSRWVVHEICIVPDEVEQIQRRIRSWADFAEGKGQVNLIVTCGGTGFAESDITPEVRLQYPSSKRLTCSRRRALHCLGCNATPP